MFMNSTCLRVLLLFLVSASALAAGETEERYYAMEQNGVVFGYAHVIIIETEIAGRPAVQLIDSIWMQMSALGKSFEGRYRFEYHIDPTNGMYFYHSSAIDQGGVKLGGIMEVLGDSMYIVSDPGDDTSIVALPPGTIRQSTRIYRHLLDFFVNDTLTKKETFVFSETSGSVNPVVFTKQGMGKLELAGKNYDALEVESIDRTTGVRIRMWVDAATGLLLKLSHPQRETYLSEASIRDRINRADLNEIIFAPVNKAIADPKSISYMKAKAKLRPGGVWITSAGLNVRGQKFDGSVDTNYIDGVFEVSHQRYDGLNAPAFPCDFSGLDSVRPYLEPSDMIESDNPTLILKAKEITAGAKDAWEAAVRLSRWVSKEIGYNLPGGSALQAYETKWGDCGSHSFLLAAFCRALSIPCRVVFGCLYVPDNGGGFGQHGWNEIYMGEAGWIPVDATAKEIDYVDCSHIRLAEVKTRVNMFNPEKMEILDYRLASDSADGRDASQSQAQYDPYVGKYQGDRGELSIVVQNGSLGLDIPGRNMIFELRNPDEGGNWFFKLSDAASISFEKDSLEAVVSMTIQERQKLPRLPGGDSAATKTAIPEAYRPIVGSYAMPMQNATLDIVFLDDNLMLQVPGGKTIVLTKSETNGQWQAEKSQNTRMALSFDTDETGKVTAMGLSTLSRCSRIVEAAIQNQTGKP